MTWYVKAEKPDGETFSILCDEPKQVAENVEDQRARGRTVWIEDTQGKKIAASVFGIKDQGPKHWADPVE